MRRLMGTLLLAAFVAAPLVAREKAEDKNSDRAKQFKELKSSFEKALGEAKKTVQTAKTDAEKRAAVQKFQKTAGESVSKAFKLVEAKPSEDVSCDVLGWLLTITGGRDKKVYDLLSEHQIDKPKLADVCLTLLDMGPPDSAKDLLRKALDKNPDKRVKALACYGLAQLVADKADQGDKDAAKEAEKLYDRAAKDFADVTLQGKTVAERAKYSRSLMIGHKAPNVVSQDLQGKKVELKDYKGKVVVLDIWATWCPPCRAMIPHEREMVKKLKGKPFALISISGDAKKETLQDFLKTTEMPWTHWWNGQTGGILKDWRVGFFPTIYVLDGKGVIRYKHVRGKQLEEAVDKLLEEDAKALR